MRNGHKHHVSKLLILVRKLHQITILHPVIRYQLPGQILFSGKRQLLSNVLSIFLFYISCFNISNYVEICITIYNRYYVQIDKMAKWLRCWIPNPGVPCSKPLGGSKLNSAFHPSEVDKMSTRTFWELSCKK